MGYAMLREPRTISPGEKSSVTLDIEDNSEPIKDIEVKFETDRKEAGKFEPEKIKTDVNGSAKVTFISNPKLRKDLDVIICASWKLNEQENSCKMLIEIRQ